MALGAIVLGALISRGKPHREALAVAANIPFKLLTIPFALFMVAAMLNELSAAVAMASEGIVRADFMRMRDLAPPGPYRSLTFLNMGLAVGLWLFWARWILYGVGAVGVLLAGRFAFHFVFGA